MYEIKEIKKQFNKSKVLKGINLKVNKGDIVAIVGGNGAGKTTFLKIMLNLLDKDSGEVFFKGKTIESYKNNLYKYIGVILEGQNNLYNYIPGIENIYYSGAMMGLSKKEVEKRSRKYLKLFDLEGAKYKNTGDYSTGMLQKLAIIIALLGEPEILFLDEPTLGLDIKSNNEFISVLKKLKAEKNITIILTSHDVETIEKLATKVAYLKNGVITEYDEIESFKNKNSSSNIKIILKNNLDINTEVVEYIQKGSNLYLKEDSDGNKMLNYLCKKGIEIDFYGKENQLREAILNLGKEETI